MHYRPLAALALAALLFGCASHKDPAQAQNAPMPTRTAPTTTMQSADYAVEGPVPAMERGRKVNEQQCTQPVDTTAGNLRCK
jgi:type IV pilus biogenesis protein CpaD/CtpE